MSWQLTPYSARSACVSGQISVDAQYRVYLCIPDRNYFKPGHGPYMWIRLVPDPTFIPESYK